MFRTSALLEPMGLRLEDDPLVRDARSAAALDGDPKLEGHVEARHARSRVGCLNTGEIVKGIVIEKRVRGPGNGVTRP